MELVFFFMIYYKQIFLSDTAEEVIISLENLRTLPEQFVKEVDCALRCSLANVEYKEKWPLEICEMLKKKLKNYEEMYIVRKVLTKIFI